jgi:hypothetical protein
MRNNKTAFPVSKKGAYYGRFSIISAFPMHPKGTRNDKSIFFDFDLLKIIDG